MHNFWKILGLSPTTDQAVIKKAYSALLKIHKPENDPEGYQALRQAFDLAIRYAKSPAKNPPRNVQQPVETRPPQAPGRPPETPQHQPVPRPAGTYEVASGLAQKILKLAAQDEQAAIREFDAVMRSEQLWEIDLKAAFERIMLFNCVNIKGRDFPLHLVQHLSDAFNWGKFAQETYGDMVRVLSDRCEFERRYQLLQSHSRHSLLSHPMNEAILVARALTGKLSRLSCRLIIFSHFYFKNIKRFFHEMETRYPSELANALSRPGMQWWHDQRRLYHFNILHIAYGFLLAIVLQVLLTPEIEEGTFGKALRTAYFGEGHAMLYVLLCLTALSAGLLYAWGSLYSRNSRLLSRFNNAILYINTLFTAQLAISSIPFWLYAFASNMTSPKWMWAPIIGFAAPSILFFKKRNLGNYFSMALVMFFPFMFAGIVMQDLLRTNIAGEIGVLFLFLLPVILLFFEYTLYVLRNKLNMRLFLLFFGACGSLAGAMLFLFIFILLT